MKIRMVDMAKTPEEIAEDAGCSPIGSQARYPYGLSISLTQDELEKLDLDADCDVGDMLHLFALAKVTALSKYDNQDGSQTRVELQITHLGLEDEDDEDEG